ncbi:MmcQ/YjbR family DNA-binding protein [Chitinophaga sedimenti]|uniref:MmcQ/YjbR family DNA-binding protein n=1 Tax=Chitinophaga sedimenti TaxID=2033606 RepID=UPI0020062178|nr:MmcQ/YjbR family DNA-binding protein [Chitinophaga sedimenti]MCK7554839.1 MmcQ/YjbR family DNA-binding protein [Chitinophaga sedimenti]
MNLEKFRDYCLSLKGTTEKFPFGETTLVFYVMDKVFALTDIELFASANLKCDPELAVELRERYSAVEPGYHMNKKHWNTVVMDGTVSDKLVLEWVKHSYDLVVAGLTKKAKAELAQL